MHITARETEGSLHSGQSLICEQPLENRQKNMAVIAVCPGNEQR